MGLIVGYERIKSKAFYHLEFELNGVTFSNSDGLIDNGVTSPEQALIIARKLQEIGLTPYINRVICYNNTKSGYLLQKNLKKKNLH